MKTELKQRNDKFGLMPKVATEYFGGGGGGGGGGYSNNLSWGQNSPSEMKGPNGWGWNNGSRDASLINSPAGGMFGVGRNNDK